MTKKAKPPTFVEAPAPTPPKPKPKPVEKLSVAIKFRKATKMVPELDRVRMDVRPLTKLQRLGLVELTSALIEHGYTLEDGKKVQRQCHAIKWMLEACASAVPFAEK